jgi:DNA repair photolyase
VPLQIRHAEARGILSATCGFIAEAGFTHSLSPARNCTFGCTYCYVPTMRIYGGLKPADWQHWGSGTTFKTNAPELLEKSLRANQIIYCSPLVDPYQPADAEEALMPRLLDAVIARPPRVSVIQTPLTNGTRRARLPPCVRRRKLQSLTNHRI